MAASKTVRLTARDVDRALAYQAKISREAGNPILARVWGEMSLAQVVSTMLCEALPEFTAQAEL